jgi:hypothetical protein
VVLAARLPFVHQHAAAGGVTVGTKSISASPVHTTSATLGVLVLAPPAVRTPGSTGPEA